MKSKFITTVGLAGALAVGSMTAVFAQSPEGQAPEGKAGMHKMHRGFKGHGMRAKRGGAWRGLDLTDAQKEQIRSIMQAEHAKMQSSRQQAGELRKALQEATKAGSFDEAQVRSIAQQQAALRVEMTVSRARIQSTIYNTVLTAEQRTKLSEQAANRAAKRDEWRAKRAERKQQRAQ